jgi:hypothetical protein
VESRGDFRQSLAPALHRIDGVRLVIGGGRPRAEVCGVGHRRPATVPISLSLASRLVAAGAPLVVRDERVREQAKELIP